MKFNLTEKDKALLAEAEIAFSEDMDYGDDEAFEFLDKVYDREAFFVQGTKESAASREKAVAYARLADKIQAQIPEE